MLAITKGEELIIAKSLEQIAATQAAWKPRRTACRNSGSQACKTMLLKQMEAKNGQYMETTGAVDKAMPLGCRAFPAKCCLQKGSPL